MSDFFIITKTPITSPNSTYRYIVSVDWTLGDSANLITRGDNFYAYWDGNKWNMSFNDLVRYVDNCVYRARDELAESKNISTDLIQVKLMSRDSSNIAYRFTNYTKLVPPKDVIMNSTLLFSDHQIVREDYATNKLEYTPTKGPTNSFMSLMGKLYSEQELTKILWFIGVILTGNSMRTQRMLFLYGAAGTGKGTAIKVIKKLLKGYWEPFSLGNLVSGGDFAASDIKEMPLLIDEDSDVRTIKNDTLLLKVTAHESIPINKKYSKQYYIEYPGLLLAASNKPIHIRDVESGLSRRVLGVYPTGNKIMSEEYNRLMDDIDFELPYIAQRAIDVFEDLGISHYDNEMPVEHMLETDKIFAFMREMAPELPDPISVRGLMQAFNAHYEGNEFGSGRLREWLIRECKRYYFDYSERKQIDGRRERAVFEHIRWDRIFPERVAAVEYDPEENTLDLGYDGPSKLDKYLSKSPAQLTNSVGNPIQKWDDVRKTLSSIDTHELHFVKLEPNHIVIDFDIPGESGKDLSANIEAASRFPKTYAEVSKSGGGIHLHYIYDGDIDLLERNVEDHIEIKVFRGNASLRRKLTRYNDRDIAHISSGLPLKKEKPMLQNISDIVYTESTLRTFIKTQLGMNPKKKPSHANTAPTIDWIASEIQKAHDIGCKYDLTDMRQAVLMRALKSTNQKDKCIRIVKDIPWDTISENEEVQAAITDGVDILEDKDLVFYDVECYPNLFVIVTKQYGKDEYKKYINPTVEEVQEIARQPLVGFYNRRYDNHIIYGAMMGKTPYELFVQSDGIVNRGDKGSSYQAAYELSYTDIWEYSQKKQSLKAWEIEMGYNHVEMEIPWDEPVPDELIDTVVDYCANDVGATEALFDYIKADYEARCILATMANGSMNATNNQLTAKLIFKEDKHPQRQFNLPPLSDEFPGYTYSYGKSLYRGIDPKEGGYVYSKPGIYKDVVLLDVESMHPWSIINLNLFGKYTKNYKELLDVRVLTKHGDVDKIKNLYNGSIAKFITSVDALQSVNLALKIAINAVYGMTSAGFDNIFKHPDNKDNIVAKRGALFMIDLQFYLEELGYNVIHIKTDSVKVAGVSGEEDEKNIVKLVSEFGRKYGYNFDHEDTYERMVLINKAAYAAFSKTGQYWTATGDDFKHSYTFKRLFTKDDITDEDYLFTRTSRGKLYLGDNFVGKVGEFYASQTGEPLSWTTDGETFNSASNTKGYKFRQTSEFSVTDVDMNYYDTRMFKTLKKIIKVGDYNDIIDDVPKRMLEMLEEDTKVAA